MTIDSTSLGPLIDITQIGSRIPGGNANEILFIDSNGKLAGDSSFTYDGSGNAKITIASGPANMFVESGNSNAQMILSTGSETNNAVFQFIRTRYASNAIWKVGIANGETGRSDSNDFSIYDVQTNGEIVRIEFGAPTLALHISDTAINFNANKDNIDTIFYNDTDETARFNAGTNNLEFKDNRYISFGTGLDVLFGYDSANTQALLDLTGVADTTFKVLTSSNGSVEVGKAGALNQTVSAYSSASGVTHYYGGSFNATRSGTQSPTNQLANGWNFTFNEEANNATRGINNLVASVNYTGDGGGSLYGLSNASFTVTDNSPNTSSMSAMRAGTFSISLRNSGATTLIQNAVALTTSIGSGGPFSGSHTSENIFGLSMGGSFGNGSGTLTVNDTFAHLSANEFGLQPTDSTVVVNFANATNVYIERMLYGTTRSGFHMATSGNAIGGDFLLGKQGNAHFLLGDGGDLIFDPTLQINAVATVAINNGGTNYVVDGIHTIDVGGNSTARIQITSVSSGVVTGLLLLDIGKDYSNTTGAATSQESFQMGGDDNLTVDIVVNPNPSLKIIGDTKIAVDDGILGFGADNEITLTHVHNTGLLLNSTSQLQFGDSGTYIAQLTDGHLDLTADVSIDLNDKLFIEASGDTFWTGDGSGLPFGHAYLFEGSTTVTVASANTWYEVTSGLTSGEVNNVTFGGAHYLAVDKAGRYRINYGASINTASAGQELMVSITVNSADNNTALNSESTNAKSAAQHETVSSNNKDCNLAGSTILDLAANDQVSIIVLNKTLSTDIVVEHVTLTLSMVGGT